MHQRAPPAPGLTDPLERLPPSILILGCDDLELFTKLRQPIHQAVRARGSSTLAVLGARVDCRSISVFVHPAEMLGPLFGIAKPPEDDSPEAKGPRAMGGEPQKIRVVDLLCSTRRDQPRRSTR